MNDKQWLDRNNRGFYSAVELFLESGVETINHPTPEGRRQFAHLCETLKALAQSAAQNMRGEAGPCLLYGEDFLRMEYRLIGDRLSAANETNDLRTTNFGHLSRFYQNTFSFPLHAFDASQQEIPLRAAQSHQTGNLKQ